MNKLLVFLGIIMPIFLIGQKEDYVWMFGDESGAPQDSFCTFSLNFNHEPPIVELINAPLYLYATYGGICDSVTGRLLYYSNGTAIHDSTHQIMQNGDSINFEADFWPDWIGGGYPAMNSMLSVRKPDSQQEHYLFHIREVWDDQYYVAFDRLLYTRLDMGLNGGLGQVVEKNVTMIADSLSIGIDAVRHANGRDWWIVCFNQWADSIYVFLLTPDEIIGPQPQSSGLRSNSARSIIGSCFSPDGSKFAVTWAQDRKIAIYNFDRCTGTFSNLRSLVEAGYYVMGATLFSPNSQWLYVSRYDTVYQYNTEAPDLEGSKNIVGIYDGFLMHNFFTADYWQMTLGPNGKIYIGASNDSHYLCTIEHPNLFGAACGFAQRSVSLPCWNRRTMPNIPNYRLGPIDGSSCDTLGINVLYPALLASPAPVDFGVVGIGLDSTRRLWLQNTGQADLYIDSLVSQDAHFTYLPQNVLVHPGDSLGVDVTFTPTQLQYVEDTLWVYSTVPGGRQGVVLRGGELPNVVLQPSIHANNGHQASFSVYPSPVGTWLSIQYEYLPEGAAFQLFDVMGRLAFAGSLSPGMGKAQINVSSLSAGLYCLRVSAERVLVGNVLVVKD